MDDTIAGGVQAGSNLFHSFREFNVDAGRSVYFADPGVNHILTRITGSNRSNINGLLGVAGNANLFLLNPNGIIFGADASLDVRGSFVATTANAIQFGTLGNFNATEPNDPALLTIAPSALLFNQIAAASQIQHQGILAVPEGQSLLLVGGSVSLMAGELYAPIGRIELGGLAQPGAIDLAIDGSLLRLSYPNGVERADVRLSQRAFVDTSGIGSGAIQIQGRNVILTEGVDVFAEVYGDQPGGNIDVQATRLELRDGSSLSTATFDAGNAGNLTIAATESVWVSGVTPSNFPGGFYTDSEGAGNAGNLTITTKRVLVDAGATIAADSVSTGTGGKLTINASESVTVTGETPLGRRPSVISTSSFAGGNGGVLTISTGQLLLQNGGRLSTAQVDLDLDTGKAGTLIINATDTVSLTNTTFRNRTYILAENVNGDGGNITINTRNLSVQDGAWISTINRGTGQGGNITVRASDRVELIGTDGLDAFNLEDSSLIVTDTLAAGNAGMLNLQARELVIRAGAQISASTLGLGKGGSAIVTAETITLEGRSASGKLRSGLFAASGIEGVPFEASGAGGSLTVNAGQILVDNGAQIAVSGLQTGEAGNLRINAGTLTLDRAGAITAATNSGEGGNVDIRANNLLILRNNSLISATAGGTGNGGNLTIAAPFVLAVAQENSDIIANALQGQGGNIRITTQGIYGLQSPPRLTDRSDITASSEFGINGVIQISTPEVDPSRGTTPLPEEVADVGNLIDTRCRVGGSDRSEFVVTGRGGLPPNPTQTLTAETVLGDLGNLERQAAMDQAAIAPKISTIRAVSATAPIVEAQTWRMDASGQIYLVASPNATAAQQVVACNGAIGQ
jgi:filamentous hemagglutinin family protein